MDTRSKTYNQLNVEKWSYKKSEPHSPHPVKIVVFPDIQGDTFTCRLVQRPQHRKINHVFVKTGHLFSADSGTQLSGFEFDSAIYHWCACGQVT